MRINQNTHFYQVRIVTSDDEVERGWHQDVEVYIETDINRLPEGGHEDRGRILFSDDLYWEEVYQNYTRLGYVEDAYYLMPQTTEITAIARTNVNDRNHPHIEINTVGGQIIKLTPRGQTTFNTAYASSAEVQELYEQGIIHPANDVEAEIANRIERDTQQNARIESERRRIAALKAKIPEYENKIIDLHYQGRKGVAEKVGLAYKTTSRASYRFGYYQSVTHWVTDEELERFINSNQSSSIDLYVEAAGMVRQAARCTIEGNATSQEDANRTAEEIKGHTVRIIETGQEGIVFWSKVRPDRTVAIGIKKDPENRAEQPT